MASIRPFRCDDLLRFNNINLDKLTETYQMTFYMSYLARWPGLCMTAESCSGALEGYILGKAEGRGMEHHGHVTAVTVAPAYRRLGLAHKLMDFLELVSDVKYQGYFVDLFVRESNDVAQAMYTKLGYRVFRRVLGYYSSGPEEDGLDMRKALSRDPDKKSMVPMTRPVHPHETVFN